MVGIKNAGNKSPAKRGPRAPPKSVNDSGLEPNYCLKQIRSMNYGAKIRLFSEKQFFLFFLKNFYFFCIISKMLLIFAVNFRTKLFKAITGFKSRIVYMRGGGVVDLTNDPHSAKYLYGTLRFFNT